MCGMNQETLEQLKKRMEEEKEIIRKELDSVADRKNGDNYVTKFPDMGSDQDDNTAEVALYGDRLSIEKKLEERLERINLALKKTETGIYGICETCGDNIDVNRLNVSPEARHCVKCHSEE